MILAAGAVLVALAFPPTLLPPAPTPDLEHAHAVRAEAARRVHLAELEQKAERERRASREAARRPLRGDSLDANVSGFLACTRKHESDTAGGYRATDAAHPGAEENMGAYQFSQSTWNATARHAHRPDLVGQRPDQATPADQDALAADLYRWQGTAPWGGRC